MKNSIVTALILLFSLSAAGLRSEKSELELECNCHSKCMLPCLKSESCSLLFSISAFRRITTPPFSGNFLISITSPNGKLITSLMLDVSNISTDPASPSHFQLTVPPSICAGNYVVSFTNLSVPGNFTLPFVAINVTNSCNSNALSLPVPLSILGFSVNPRPSSTIAIGESTEVKVYIPESFVPFTPCKTECTCEE